jgi:hypothetical protein
LDDASAENAGQDGSLAYRRNQRTNGIGHAKEDDDRKAVIYDRLEKRW